jgi:tetratricopeptide (TPR) repeat protein
MCARALALACLALAAPAIAAPPVDGEYDSPLGRVRITGDGAAFNGTIVSPREGVPLREGDAVLRATLLDDSLAGQVRVPLLKVKTCRLREAWANAVLLVSEGGLTGAVHVPKGCKAPIGRKGGVTFARVGVALAPPSRPPPDPAEAAAATPSVASRTVASTPAGRKAARERARAVMRDGATYLAEGNFEQARRRFLEALDEDATVPEAYNGVGVTYRARNDLPRALDWYKRALSVDPDFGDAYYNMACIYAMQGEKEMALRYLQIAALNGYATAEGMDQDPDLAPLREEKAYQALVRQKM